MDFFRFLIGLIVSTNIMFWPSYGILGDGYKAFYAANILGFFATMLNEAIQVLKDLKHK
jgi:hypothetical protein